jgi:hypothetical protein
MVHRIQTNFPGQDFIHHVEHDRIVRLQSDGSALDRDRIWLGPGNLIRILDHGLSWWCSA